MKARLIALTGGIGSGKSVVSRILSSMGYDVYDSDSRAKMILDNSIEAKNRIRNEIDSASVRPDGTIDRKRLARVVFNDSHALSKLNSIVHSMVIDDSTEWANAATKGLAFIETALLYQSGLDKHVDEVWDVEAPIDIRISRVRHRDGCEEDDVKARINSQIFIPEKVHPVVRTIVNDGNHSLLLRISHLLSLASAM